MSPPMLPWSHMSIGTPGTSRTIPTASSSLPFVFAKKPTLHPPVAEGARMTPEARNFASSVLLSFSMQPRPPASVDIPGTHRHLRQVTIVFGENPKPDPPVAEGARMIPKA